MYVLILWEAGSGNWEMKLYFQTVRLLPGGTGIEWMNGQDIAPHELYENGILQGK